MDLAEIVFGHSIIKLTTFIRIYANDGTSKLCLSSVRTMRLGPQTTGIIFKTQGKKEEGRPAEEGRGNVSSAADLLFSPFSLPYFPQWLLPRNT